MHLRECPKCLIGSCIATGDISVLMVGARAAVTRPVIIAYDDARRQHGNNC